MKSAKTIFEAELKRRGVEFTPLSEPGLYEVEAGGRKLTVSLDNIDRNYRRDNNPDSVIRLVDRVLTPVSTPSWELAKSRLDRRSVVVR